MDSTKQGSIRTATREALISSRVAFTENVRVEFLQCRTQATVHWKVAGSEISLVWISTPATNPRIATTSRGVANPAKANFWFFPEGIDAEGELTAEADYECAGVFVEPSFLSPTARQVLVKSIVGFSHTLLGKAFNELIGELREPAAVEPAAVLPLFIEGCVMQALAYIAWATNGPQPEPALTCSGLAPWQLRRARELLRAGLAEKLSMGRAAAACKLSVSRFARAFKASTGLTPHQWVLAARIEMARDLLANSTMSLIEVADECGFADQAHFTRVFGRIVGTTPSAWRRRLNIGGAGAPTG